ncbi:MAG TPA: methionyl-tRNA formyltransferase [Candidatus Peribacterales bacterium]|nr:methionyl-tRNA formyltransferase [Candidatus Peribacterales bacterium]
MSPKTIIFCGTPEFACPSLLALRNDSAFEVTHVITQPDKPKGRRQTLVAPPVKSLAEKLGIPVLQPSNINILLTGGTSKLKAPDFLVVVAYGQIFSKELLAWPTIAPINLHASLLPRWRGASPIQHAILMGDQETGISVQRMAEKLDTGPILAQESTAIAPRETFQALHDKLSELGASLLIETLKNPLKETPQNEGEATFCSKLTRSRGVTDPSTMTAEEIDHFVRALVPWPGVTTKIKGREVKLIEASLDPHPDALELACAKGTTLFILTAQSPGKKPMRGKEWKKGLQS